MNDLLVRMLQTLDANDRAGVREFLRELERQGYLHSIGSHTFFAVRDVETGKWFRHNPNALGGTWVTHPQPFATRHDAIKAVALVPQIEEREIDMEVIEVQPLPLDIHTVPKVVGISTGFEAGVVAAVPHTVMIPFPMNPASGFSTLVTLDEGEDPNLLVDPLLVNVLAGLAGPLPDEEDVPDIPWAQDEFSFPEDTNE